MMLRIWLTCRNHDSSRKGCYDDVGRLEQEIEQPGSAIPKALRRES